MSASPDEKAVPAGLTPEEDRIHVAGFAAIQEGLASGLGFDKACERIESPDADLRRIIVDDFLKVTIAQRNFEGRESTADIAASLGISIERVEYARREMMAEVAAASVDVFRRQGGQVPDA